MEKGLTAISDEDTKVFGAAMHPAVHTTKKRFVNAGDGYIGSATRFVKAGDMAEGFVHTVHVNGRWLNSLEGQDRVLLGTFDTEEEAVEAGREAASRRLTEHLIHNEDLSIAEAPLTAATRPTAAPNPEPP